MIYLIEYDRKQGRIRTLRSFSDRAEARKERLRIELSRVPYEVVLLEAADKKILKRTHQRYFKTPHELVRSMSQVRLSEPALKALPGSKRRA